MRTTPPHLSRFLIACAVLIAAMAPPAAAQEFYVVDRNKAMLSRITAAGDILDQKAIVGAGPLSRGLALHPNGMLYLGHVADGFHRVVRIDPATGMAESLAPLYLRGIATDPVSGRLYGINFTGEFVEIDPDSGEPTVIGTIEAPPIPSVLGLAIRADGTGYFKDFDANDLYRFELATLEAELICTLDAPPFEDFTVDGAGVLWGKTGGVRRIDSQACQTEVVNAAAGTGIAAILGQACYADCDGDGDLALFDFLCFVNGFNAGGGGADCDGDGALTVFDFLCFVNAYNAGC